jgi:autonomous glycyl radical cofactor GrcA
MSWMPHKEMMDCLVWKQSFHKARKSQMFGNFQKEMMDC